MAPDNLVPAPTTTYSRKEAFEVYFALGMDGDRDLRLVADATGVNIKIIRQWAREDKWDDRVAMREGKINAELDKVVVEKVAEIKTRYAKKLNDFITNWFDKNLGDPEQAAILMATTDVDGLVKLIKLQMVLLGQPDTIKLLEGKVTHSVDDSLRGLSTEELRKLANRPKALTERNDLVVDAVIVEEPKA